MMRRRLLALVVVVALGLTGCGGDGGKKTAKKSDGEKMREFAQCMRANGIDMKDPGEGRNEAKVEGKNGRDKWQAAEAKCRHLMPNGGKPKKPSAEELAKLRALAKCMRANGVNMPDPDPQNGAMQVRRTRAEDKKDQNKVAAAEKACQKYHPKRTD